MNTPKTGRITNQQIPQTRMQSMLAGMQAKQQAAPPTASLMQLPMKGMQSAATPRGATQQEKAIQRATKPTNRNIHVRAVSWSASSSNKVCLER
mmetsp:Transcript_27727/g.64496  ORF Transcript_27727/g.64496 Transcript_27727/m.64496 type:complete len:94 (+) Transcript_27727:295-576(+)